MSFGPPLAFSVWTAATFAATGCGDAGTGDAGERFRITVAVDSSTGVETVESAGERWTEGNRWRVRSDPTLRIGGSAESHATLFQVSDAIRLSNGTVVIANAGGREILFIRANGDRIATVDNPGEGPGEYQQIHELALLPGNSVAAFDGGLRRIVIFDSVGRPDRTVSIGPSGNAELIGAVPGPCFLLAHFSSPVQSPSDPRPQSLARPVSYVLHGSDGNPLDTVAALTAGNALSRVGGRWGWIRTPFGSGPVATTSGDRIFVGNGEDYEISVFRADGTLLRILRRSGPRREVAPRMIAEYKDRVLRSQSENPALQAEMENVIQAIPWPTFFPAFESILADEEGCVWVCEGGRTQSDAGCWTVFGTDGGVLGRANIPTDLESILQVGTTFLLGLRFDHEEPEILVYELDRFNAS